MRRIVIFDERRGGLAVQSRRKGRKIGGGHVTYAQTIL